MGQLLSARQELREKEKGNEMNLMRGAAAALLCSSPDPPVYLTPARWQRTRNPPWQRIIGTRVQLLSVFYGRDNKKSRDAAGVLEEIAYSLACSFFTTIRTQAKDKE